MMVIIDYCGWRMIASSCLPLDKSTLAYGSDGYPSLSYFSLLFSSFLFFVLFYFLTLILFLSLCVLFVDGGKTVRDDNPALSELMTEAAKHINIKPHICGDNQRLLAAPTDIEGKPLFYFFSLYFFVQKFILFFQVM